MTNNENVRSGHHKIIADSFLKFRIWVQQVNLGAVPPPPPAPCSKPQLPWDGMNWQVTLPHLSGCLHQLLKLIILNKPVGDIIWMLVAIMTS